MSVQDEPNVGEPVSRAVAPPPVLQGSKPQKAKPISKQALVWWGVFIVLGLAFTCITPFINDRWWFAPERAAFRQLLDLLRWGFIIGLAVYSKFFDQYAKERKAREKAAK